MDKHFFTEDITLGPTLYMQGYVKSSYNKEKFEKYGNNVR